MAEDTAVRRRHTATLNVTQFVRERRVSHAHLSERGGPRRSAGAPCRHAEPLDRRPSRPAALSSQNTARASPGDCAAHQGGWRNTGTMHQRSLCRSSAPVACLTEEARQAVVVLPARYCVRTHGASSTIGGRDGNYSDERTAKSSPADEVCRQPSVDAAFGYGTRQGATLPDGGPSTPGKLRWPPGQAHGAQLLVDENRCAQQESDACIRPAFLDAAWRSHLQGRGVAAAEGSACGLWLLAGRDGIQALHRCGSLPATPHPSTALRRLWRSLKPPSLKSPSLMTWRLTPSIIAVHGNFFVL